MSELEQLEQRIEKLSKDELRRFREWFVAFDARNWDYQIAQDSASGKLDQFVSEALSEYKAGKSREL